MHEKGDRGLAWLLRKVCAGKAAIFHFFHFKGILMRTLISSAILFAASFSAYAGPGGPTPLPEPGVIALVGVGIAALYLTRRSKK